MEKPCQCQDECIHVFSLVWECAWSQGSEGDWGWVSDAGRDHSRDAGQDAARDRDGARDAGKDRVGSRWCSCAPSQGHTLCTLRAHPLLSELDPALLSDGGSLEGWGRDGHFHKKENKRFSKQTISSGRPCKEAEVLGGGKLHALGVSPVAGQREGSEERGTAARTPRCLQHSSVLWTERDSHGAGAFQKDPVGDQLRFWLLPASPGPLCAAVCGTAPIASRRDQALLLLSPANVLWPGSINVPTVALD